MAKRNSTIKAFTPRQPATEGPDVVFNGIDHDIYVDARYLGSRANSQDAWIEARAAHFNGIADSSDQTPIEAEDVEVLAYLRGFEAGKRDAIKNIWRLLEATDTAPQITATPHICDDVNDKAHFGKHAWTDFSAGTDSEGHTTEITCYEPIYDNRANVPTLFAFGEDVGWPLTEVDRVLPQINALMNSPEVKAARAQWEARQVQQTKKAA